MKALALVFSVLVAAQAVPNIFFHRPQKEKGYYISKVVSILPRKTNAAVDLCPTCIDFTDDAIEELVDIILNAGVIGTCGELCQLLAEKTGSQILGAVCDILCDVVGIDEFIKLIDKADLDPIYFCELIKICPVFDQGDAMITQLTVTPDSGPQGPRAIKLMYQSNNGTGTGEIDLFVQTVDKIPVEGGFINKRGQPGIYSASFNLKAEPDPNCDPTTDFCEQWLPGVYTLHIDICNGECGSKHPHSQVYDSKEVNFTITDERHKFAYL